MKKLFIETFIEWSITLTLTAIIVVLMFVVYSAIFSSARISHCTVEHEASPARPSTYVVYGHVPWRGATVVAIAPTAEEAAAKRDLLCPR